MTQDEALQLLKLGRNVFLTGSAGSGKTYLLNRYIEYLQRYKVGVSVTASTGLAATHLNGRTIHSWSGIGVRETLSDKELNTLQRDKRVRKRYLKTKVLIIDEVSMIHAYQLELLDRVARHLLEPLLPFGGLQIVLCGDFFQLPPVTTKASSSTRFAFDSIAWKTADFCTCYLHEQHRQGHDPLLQILNDIRSGNTGEHTKAPLRTRYRKPPTGPIEPTKLFARNINVDNINNKELNTLKGTENIFQMTTQGSRVLVDALKRNCPAPGELRLKIQSKVMFVKNATDGSYVNGTLGQVKSFDSDGMPIIETYDGSIVATEPDDWKHEEDDKVLATISQVPLKLAWAITVHKSQGMSLDAAEIDLSDAFEPGMGYVALSRLRSLSGLNLLGLNDTALTVHPLILDKDHAFQCQSKEAVEQLATLSEAQRNSQQIDILLNRFRGKRTAEGPLTTPTPKHTKALKPTSPSDGTFIKADQPLNAYQPWSDAEDKSLTDLYEDELPIKSIATQLQRGSGAIRSRLKKLNLIHAAEKKPSLLEPPPHADIPYKKAYEPWSDAEEKTLAALHTEGQTIKSIATQLQRGSGAIRSRLKKLNLIQPKERDKSPDIKLTSQSAHSLSADGISASLQETRNLLLQSTSLENMAKLRALSKDTILRHIESLNEKNTLPDINYLASTIDNFDEILELFKQADSHRLAPIYEKLKGNTPYETLRVVRLFIEPSR